MGFAARMDCRRGRPRTAERMGFHRLPVEHRDSPRVVHTSLRAPAPAGHTDSAERMDFVAHRDCPHRRSSGRTTIAEDRVSIELTLQIGARDFTRGDKGFQGKRTIIESG
jgi:hypothetical protein